MLWRGVEEPVPSVAEGTPRVLTLLVPFAPFQPPKPAHGGPVTVFPRGREQELVASCYVRRSHSRQPPQQSFTTP
jgi:hypothetical protein